MTLLAPSEYQTSPTSFFPYTKGRKTKKAMTGERYKKSHLHIYPTSLHWTLVLKPCPVLVLLPKVCPGNKIPISIYLSRQQGNFHKSDAWNRNCREGNELSELLARKGHMLVPLIFKSMSGGFFKLHLEYELLLDIPNTSQSDIYINHIEVWYHF